MSVPSICCGCWCKRYIQEGLAGRSTYAVGVTALELSPATIRNATADLEDMGLRTLAAYSAGRVPTVQGYRLFVDSLLTVRLAVRRKWVAIKAATGAGSRAAGSDRGRSASNMLIGHQLDRGPARAATTPRREHRALRQVEFPAVVRHRRTGHPGDLRAGRSTTGSSPRAAPTAPPSWKRRRTT